MAISRLSASRVTQGLPRFQSAWDQDSVQQGALVPIQRITMASNSSVQFDFTNIPQIYQDLMLVISYTKTTGTFDPWLALNADFTGNTAGRIQMYAEGTNHLGEVRTNDSVLYCPDGGAHVAGFFVNQIINIFDYTSANRKVVLGQGSSTRSSTYWSSVFCGSKTIGAVNSISFHGNDGNIGAGSTATLYGIKGGI